MYMNRKSLFTKLVVSVLSVVGILFAPSAVFAAASVTTLASASVSADTTGGSYTTLTGPVVQEGAYRDFPASGNVVLNVPTGFAFNTGANVTATIVRTAGTGNCFNFSALTVTPTASSVTFALSARDTVSNTTRCKVTFSNIQVRPTAGTPLAVGNITKGTGATVVGITNGTTNFGTLTEVAGSKNKLTFTTQPSSTVTVDTDLATKPIVRMEDQFGNPNTTDTSVVTHSAVLSGQACGGTSGTGLITSIPASGANLVSGVMTYTAMQYSAVESIHICTASTGVTSAKSNAITIGKKTTTTALATSLTPQVYGTSVTFTATVTPSSGGPATGSVTFKDGATTIGTGTLNSNVATFSTSTLSVTGSPHSITAEYGGDSKFLGSTSSAVSQTMTVKALTVTGITADNKIYNGTATTTLSTGSYALVGVVSGDTVTLNTSAYVATFANKNIGIGKAVTVTGLSLSGASASNYSLRQPTGLTADITAKALTTSGITALNKIYDGGTTAYLSGGSLVGVVSGDTVTISASSSSFADKTVATGKAVTVNSITLSGTDSGNYTVTLPIGLIANITAKNLTVSGMSASSKEYDGNANATLSGGSLVGVVGGDTVSIASSTASFVDKNVGTGKTVTVNSITLGGTDSGNYTVSLPSVANVNITAKALAVTGMTATSREYTGDTTVILSGGSLVGVIGSDIVSIDTRSGSFATKIVGTAKAVTVSSVTLTGTDAGNYIVTPPTDVTANITAKTLTVTGIQATTREYNADVNVTLTNGSLVGVIGADVVSINTRSGSFVDKNVGTSKPITVSSVTLTGTDSGNYNVTSPTDVTGNITLKALTVTGITATSREYNADVNVTLNEGSLVGVINPDVVSIDTRVGAFATKVVGTGKTVIVSSVTLTGTDAGNYTVSNPTGITANITAKNLTVSGMTAVSREYNADVNVVLNGGSLVGIISPDVVSIDTRVGSFADKNVGTTKTVTVSSVILTGTDAGNYSVTLPTGITADITSKALMVSGMSASNKEYDGFATATLSGGSLVGIISPDVVSINTRTGSFADKTIANGKTVTVNLVTLTGTDSVNYTVTLPTGITANITTKTLTVTGMTADNKEYDREITATLSGGSLVGIISPDDVSINTRVGTFADKNIGTGKSITVSSVTLTGVDAGNYTVTNPTGITANITAKNLTVDNMTATSREYDRDTNVILSGGSLVGVISPDVVSIDTRVGSFTDKTVGIAKPITVSSVTLTGTDSGNYTVTLPTGITANITSKTITVIGVVVDDKPYDGNTTATLNTTSASLVGVISGDIVTLDITGATASFATSDVELNKTVSVSGLALSGTDGGNYSLTPPTGFTASILNPTPITTSISPTFKEAGDPGFTLTVNGSGFMSNSVVKLNGDPRTTTFVNGGQLTAEILTSDLTNPNTGIAITVFTPTPGGGTSNSQTFVVVRSATQFVILASVAGSVDATSTVTVQAQKANGAVDVSFQDDVTLNTNGSATGGGLIDIVNGEGTISISDTVSETVHLTLTDSQSTGLAVSSSQDLVFAPGAVTQYTLNSPGNMNARTRLGFQVTRKDQYGNSVLANSLTAYLYTTSSSTDRAFYDDSLGGNVISEVSFASSSATANFWYYDDVPGTYTLMVSDHTPSADGATGIVDATRDVTVIPVAVKFVVTAASSTSVDSPVTVTVEAQKIDNTIDTSFQDDVILNTTGSATGAGLVSIVNGVGTKQISDTVVENITLSLSDTAGAGLDVSSTANVSFTGGTTTQATLDDQTTLSAGNRVGYTVTRKDQYGNITNLGDTTLYLYSSSVGANKKIYNAATDGSVISSVTISSGQQSAQFWYYDEMPGTWTITASDGTPTQNGPTGISDAVDVLTVVPGSVSLFTLNTPGNMTASTRLGYTVTRKDQFGNLVTNGDTTAYLYTTAGTLGLGRDFYDAATLGNTISSVIIANGTSQSSFWYYEETAGSYIISASDSSLGADGLTGIVDGTRDVTVHPAPIVATRFVILDPTDGTVDAPITVTIQAQDNAGNLDTSATSSVTLVTNGSATGAGLVTMVAGVGTIQISDHNAQTVLFSLLDAGAGLGVSSTQDVVFATGAVAQLSIDNPGDIGAGSRLSFTITRKDQYGNIVTSGVTAVGLESSSAGVNKKFYDAVSGGSVITSVNILDGQSTAQFWYYDELTGSITVTVSGTGITGAQRTFTVTPGAIAKFTIDNPGNMTAGTRLGYTLTRKDTFDNLVTSGIVSAYLYSSATGGITKFYDAASGGIQTNVAAFADGNSTANFWYYEEAPGTWVITASDGTPIANGSTGLADAADSVTVTVATITATRFVIQPVNNSTVNIPVTVTVRAEDESGNVATTYNNNVTLVVSGSATGGGLVTMVNGVGTKTINDSIAETITLSLLDSQTTGLNISSLRTVTFSAVFTPPVAVRPSAPVPTPIISGVRLTGRAFPGASLNIIAISGADTLQSQKGTATANGSFVINFTGLTGGARSYGIIGMDKNNNTTQVKIFDANMANRLLQLDVNGILLSPTIGLIRSAITKGDVLGINGAGVPSYKIEVQVDNQPTIITTTVDSKGVYKAVVPTSELELGSHTIRTRQISPAGLKSDYSPQEVFSIVNIFTPNMDFNSDGAIGIQDYSIFISRWQSADPKLRAKNDLNGDGKVDVQDFSIFVRTLKIK